MKKLIKLVFILSIFLLVGKSHAQISVGGLLDIVYKNSDNNDVTNLTFRKFSNFNSSRLRLFFDHAPSENVEVFVQVLSDTYTFQLYSAYIRFTDIGLLHLNAQVGLIPSTIGSWGSRTYSNVNPLIGIPLLYNMHSSYIPGGPTAVRTADEIITLRDNRSNKGLPLIYDACWNTGVELYGSSGKFTYSLGLLTGSISKPTTEQKKNVPQITTHFTYDVSNRITFGGSAYIGPYLFEGLYNDSLPIGAKYNDYMNAGIGYELHYEGRYLEVYSESFYSYWEHPYLNKLELSSGYVEGKYKFKPGWFFAGRYGFFQPGKLIDSQGTSQYWDYPLKRFEGGIGYKPNRSTTLKLVTQLNKFDINNSLNSELYALQIAVSFD